MLTVTALTPTFYANLVRCSAASGLVRTSATMVSVLM